MTGQQSHWNSFCGRRSCMALFSLVSVGPLLFPSLPDSVRTSPKSRSVFAWHVRWLVAVNYKWCRCSWGVAAPQIPRFGRLQPLQSPRRGVGRGGRADEDRKSFIFTVWAFPGGRETVFFGGRGPRCFLKWFPGTRGRQPSIVDQILFVLISAIPKHNVQAAEKRLGKWPARVSN